MCIPIIFYKLATNDVGEPSKSTTSSFREVCPLNEARDAPRRKHTYIITWLFPRRARWQTGCFTSCFRSKAQLAQVSPSRSMLAFNTASAGDGVGDAPCLALSAASFRRFQGFQTDFLSEPGYLQPVLHHLPHTHPASARPCSTRSFQEMRNSGTTWSQATIQM